jgi:hypothetical protein
MTYLIWMTEMGYFQMRFLKIAQNAAGAWGCAAAAAAAADAALMTTIMEPVNDCK